MLFLSPLVEYKLEKGQDLEERQGLIDRLFLPQKTTLNITLKALDSFLQVMENRKERDATSPV